MELYSFLKLYIRRAIKNNEQAGKLKIECALYANFKIFNKRKKNLQEFHISFFNDT